MRQPSSNEEGFLFCTGDLYPTCQPGRFAEVAKQEIVMTVHVQLLSAFIRKADIAATQLVLRGQNDTQAQQSQQPTQTQQQSQQRRSYPARQQAKPTLYAPPKPVARLGKVVAQRIK